ncbi:tetratricopeptide repeat protein [Oscillibacter sp. GMB15532]|uniref:tetratricopeptide repeat protein n=1 Tax=Oscillibacter sp. GMB15532 TaxID=3230022 RepID=UPI0034DEA319
MIFTQNELDILFANLNDCLTHKDSKITAWFSPERMRQSDAHPEEYIASYNELGVFCRDSGRLPQSLEWFEKARALADVHPDLTCGEYAALLNNMAGTYRLMGQNGKAIEVLVQAADLCWRDRKQETYAYVGVLRNLAMAYWADGQPEPAIRRLLEALPLLQILPEHRHETAVIYSNLTALYHAAGDKSRAMQALNRAMQECEKNREDENVHYAAILNTLAGFLFSEKDFRRAAMLYRKSARHIRRFYGQTLEYAYICQNLCWVYEKMGERGRASDALSEAMKIFEKLLGPNHERTVLVRGILARMKAGEAP